MINDRGYKLINAITTLDNSPEFKEYLRQNNLGHAMEFMVQMISYTHGIHEEFWTQFEAHRNDNNT